MCYTTPNKATYHTKARSVSPLTWLMLLCSVVSFAQLKVNPNTAFTANNVVTSKETKNVFDSNVLGNSQLVLNGTSQQLETAENTSLPTLYVANGDQLDIKTEVRLRGDLIIKTGTLVLQKPLQVAGEVKIDKRAKVLNSFYINYKTPYQFEKSGMPLAVQHGVPIFAADVAQNTTTIAFVSTAQKLKIKHLNETISNQFKGNPFAPPPELNPMV